MRSLPAVPFSIVEELSPVIILSDDNNHTGFATPLQFIHSMVGMDADTIQR